MSRLLESSHLLSGCFTVIGLPTEIWNSDLVHQSHKRQGTDLVYVFSLIYYDIYRQLGEIVSVKYGNICTETGPCQYDINLWHSPLGSGFSDFNSKFS